jgi:hypothetical protein
VIRRGFEKERGLLDFMGDVGVKQSWPVKHFSYLDDVAVGVVGIIIDADEAVTGAGDGDKTADVCGRVTGNIADAVAFAGYYLDCVGVIRVSGVCDKGSDELAKMLIDVFAVRDACNTELKVVYALNALNLGPDADMVAFVFNTEMLEGLSFSDGGTVGHSGGIGVGRTDTVAR